MKNCYFALLWLLSGACVNWAQSLELPVQNSQTYNEVDLDGDQLPELTYSVDKHRDIPDREVYIIIYSVIPNSQSKLLRHTNTQIDFSLGSFINSDNRDYNDKLPFPQPDLTIGGFLEQFALGMWFYMDVTRDLREPFFTNRTEIIIGFRSDLQDGRHYGWLQFRRPNTTFTTPFVLQSLDWHPIPGASINAGEAPVIPIGAEIAARPEGPTLVLSWHPAVAGWVFESAGDLTPPVRWETYPAGSTGTDVPLAEFSAGNRYFRLRRPD